MAGGQIPSPFKFCRRILTIHIEFDTRRQAALPWTCGPPVKNILPYTTVDSRYWFCFFTKRCPDRSKHLLYQFDLDSSAGGCQLLRQPNDNNDDSFQFSSIMVIYSHSFFQDALVHAIPEPVPAALNGRNIQIWTSLEGKKTTDWLNSALANRINRLRACVRT